MNNDQFFIVLTGPTGTGKSAVGLELAHHLPIEIINGDMGQLYTPLSIGTAKPSVDERSRVPHHLFDVLHEPVNFTVAQYRARVEQVMREVWGRNNIPVVVGGSGFYIKSLFFPQGEPWTHCAPAGLVGSPSEQTAGSVYSSLTTSELWQKLHDIDPARAAQIHQNDRYRLERALDLWMQTGTLPSTHAPIYNPIAPYKLFMLTRERPELYARIDDRVVAMMPDWLTEVQALKNTDWEQFLRKKKVIGYTTLLDYFHAKIALDAAIAIIQRDTRRYAKRQTTFFRSLLEQLPQECAETINMTVLPIDAVVQKIISCYIPRVKNNFSS